MQQTTVTDKWLTDHNWGKQIFDVPEYEGEIKQIQAYTIVNGKLFARYDKTVVTNVRTKKRRVFYQFFAKGSTRFKVSCLVSSKNFKIKDIISALNTVGYDEFGNWID